MTTSLETTTRKLLRSYPQAFDTDRDGLITMMLQQFSNPYLAFREIIQNSVDEKATKIKVEIAQKSWKERVVVSIEDDGKGMDLEGVRRYLTLFDSTKEEILETIGEMGVGKIFAFALNPDYLVIDTGKGKESYRIIFNKDMSGKLSEISPRKGTKVTLVLACENQDEVMESVRASIIDSCSYVTPKITINGKKINQEFNINTENKVIVEEGSTRAVIGLTGNTYYQLFKGGISLERGHHLNCDNKTPFADLEVLADSYEFNQPISRNAVNKDENFRKVIHGLLKAKDTLTQQLAERFPTMDASSEEAWRVKGYLRNIARQDDSFSYRDLKIFSTVDGIPLSYDDILMAAVKAGTLYYSNCQANSNEITYFTDREIPIAHIDINFAGIFGKRHNLGWQIISGNLIIEGLSSHKKKYRESFRESLYLNSLLDCLKYNPIKKYKSVVKGITATVDGSDSIADDSTYEGSSSSESTSGSNNTTFDWNKIREFKFEYFLDLKGNPREDLSFYRLENKVIINIHNPYVKTMLKLRESNHDLSIYYLLCEVAASKAVFPNADHKTVEDFIILKGQNLL